MKKLLASQAEGKPLPLVALLAGVLAISWSAIFVRWAQMPGVASAFYRLLIASVSLWLMWLIRKPGQSLPRLSLPRGTSLWLALLGGAFFAGDVACYNVAVLRTTAGGATFLGNNAPVLLGMFTWIATRKLPSARLGAALTVGSLGGWLIVWVDHLHTPARTGGDGFALLACLFFALYLFATARVREQVDALTLATLSATSSAVCVLLFALVRHTPLGVPGWSSLASLVGLGLVCQCAGYLCVTYALGHLPATSSSVVLLAVAPLSAALAWLCFREPMAWTQWAVGGLILTAVWLARQKAAERLPAVAA